MASVFCVICQTNEDAGWCATGCGHVFHERCLNTWLVEHTTCPHCNGRVTPSARHIMRLYLATENDAIRHESRERSAAVGAVGGSSAPAETGELAQLREMLFMESQERDAAWRQAQDSEKVIAKLKSDRVSEAQRMATYEAEYEKLQVIMVQREHQTEEVMRLAALEQRHSQVLVEQLEHTNRRLEASKAQLNQQLQSAEQRNRELRSQADALQANGTAATARLQAKIVDMERRVTQLQEALNTEKSLRELESQQIVDTVSENSRLTERLSGLQTVYASLRSAANEEVNKQKELCAGAQSQIRDLEAKLRTATEALVRAGRDKESLSERLKASESNVSGLQLKLQGQQMIHEISAGLVAPQGIFRPTAALETETNAQDNFADFPVLGLPQFEQHQQLPVPMTPLSKHKPQYQSTPSLFQPSRPESNGTDLYDPPPETSRLYRRADSVTTIPRQDETRRKEGRKGKAKEQEKCRLM